MGTGENSNTERKSRAGTFLLPGKPQDVFFEMVKYSLDDHCGNTEFPKQLRKDTESMVRALPWEVLLAASEKMIAARQEWKKDQRTIRTVVEKAYDAVLSGHVQYKVANSKPLDADGIQWLQNLFLAFFDNPQAYYREGDTGYNAHIQQRFQSISESICYNGLNGIVDRQSIKRYAGCIKNDAIAEKFTEEMTKAFNERYGAPELKPYVELKAPKSHGL